MARPVIWTESFARDLDAVAEYIARDSPRYAASFVREVRDAARSLSHFAERGRMVPEFGSPAIRELFLRSYRLIYHLGPDTVSILALIHGARDLASRWEEEGRPPVDDVV